MSNWFLNGDLPYMDGWWLPNPPYGYVPTKSACVVFVVAFAISTLLHMATAWRHRMWWLFPTVCLACVMELVGWSVRAWSSHSPQAAESVVAFWIQWTTLFIAPNFTIAALVIIFSQITGSSSLSRFRRIQPRRNLAMFLISGGISLFIQIPGGIMIAVLSKSSAGPDLFAQPVALAGIGLLLVILLVFIYLIADFTIRLCRKKSSGSRPRDLAAAGEEDTKIKYMMFAIILCSLLLLTRTSWRMAQLLSSFVDPFNTTELYTCVLDGAMIASVVLILNVVQPAHSQIFEAKTPATHLLVASPRDAAYNDDETNFDAASAPSPTTSTSRLVAVEPPPGNDQKHVEDSETA